MLWNMLAIHMLHWRSHDLYRHIPLKPIKAELLKQRKSVSFMRLLFYDFRRNNFILSIALLLSCYSAILVPAYLPTPEPTWTNDSSAETLVRSFTACLDHMKLKNWVNLKNVTLLIIIKATWHSTLTLLQDWDDL